MRLLGIPCVLVLLAAVAAPAPAAVVSKDDSEVVVEAPPGERNALSVAVSADRRTVVVEDAATGPTAGAGCEAARPGVVICRSGDDDRFYRVGVRLGDQDDLATLRAEGADGINLSVSAGAGNDRVEADTDAYLDGDEGDDVLETRGRAVGGPGDDRLIGRAGLNGGLGDDLLRAKGAIDATLDGGPGRDRLLGARGDDHLVDDDGAFAAPDRYDGGPGSDTVSYAERLELEPVWIDLVAGTATTQDAVTDALRSIENANGGGGDDVVRGDAGTNVLYGDDGRDRLIGRDGDDALVDDDGLDLLRGGRGDDELDGGDQRDRLLGGPGADDLEGGDQGDRLLGGRGDDALDGGEHADVLDGGPGLDATRARGGDDRLVVGADELATAGPGADDVRVLGAGASVWVSHDWERDEVRCAAPAFGVVAEPGDRVGRGCRSVVREPLWPLLAGAQDGGVPKWRIYRTRDRKDVLSGPLLAPRIFCSDSVNECDGRITLRFRGRTIASDRFNGYTIGYSRMELPQRFADRVERAERLEVTMVVRLDLGPGTFPVADRAIVVRERVDKDADG